MTTKKKSRNKSTSNSNNELMLDDEFSLESQESTVSGAAPKKKASKKKSTSKKKKDQSAEILSYRYDDKRKNNPHVGMVDVAADHDEKITTWAYDPHIDPELQFDSSRAEIEDLIDNALAVGDDKTMRSALEQLKRMQSPYLNWAGKAEGTSFEVDTVSLHVHERIDPATIIAGLQKRIKNSKGKEAPVFQSDLFHAPFENLPLRDAIDFYKHERDWSNRLIAGDSLLVMNSLLQKEGMAGQVQMIYIDPPYGIKYGSNFQPFVNKRDVKDGKDEDLTQEPEMIKAFRDTWELGIHSYLTYLRDRFFIAKELLKESGSIFVQISDENLHHVRELMDDIFGCENFVCIITFKKKANQKGELLESISDYIIFYAKNKRELKYNHIFQKQSDKYTEYSSDLTGGGVFKTQIFPFEYQGKTYKPASGNSWKTALDGMQRICNVNRIKLGASQIRYRRLSTDFGMSAVTNFWGDTGGATDKVYVVQTSIKVLDRLILMATETGDLVLDPTCGSGTTAFVSEKNGRRWITCDTSRVAVTLAKQRLMTASYDYYELKYPHEGLKGGFIYKTVPHITLKSIANNSEIDEIYKRMHPAIVSALVELNEALDFRLRGNDDGLKEWEVQFEFPINWPEKSRKAFGEFQAARTAMQQKMDASISAHAGQEVLYDQPQVSKTKMRITGPFTVEAVPFATVLGLDEAEQPKEADVAVARSGATLRNSRWRDELLKTGIRGKGGQQIQLLDLEPLPGAKYVHAVGMVKDSGEKVAVSFGPEHAALEQRQVEIAMREAGELFPLPKMLVFCAFTFDPEAAKDIDNIKGITALKVQMNIDLLTEDLKKGRASNQSFWLMGQPDVEVRKRKDGYYEVEVHGFDYFDTNSGELKSGGKKNIAMWALDTDYDNRSLYPQQVFFPIAGSKEGWHKLKKAIKAELDESLLEQFHGTQSLPFEKGDNECIAVKIVDDRGIESLKVINLD